MDAHHRVGAVMSAETTKTRRYDAGSTAARLSSWLAPGTDATAAINNPSLIRNRARDLVRNNPWAAKGLTVIVNNTVGPGIQCQIKGGKGKLKKITALWQEWAGTSVCDADGTLDFAGIQQLVMRTVAESGEALVRMRMRQTRDGLAVPMQLQVLEPDMIVDTATITGASTGHQVIRGIEYDAIGRRVAYYLYRVHPGSMVLNVSSAQYSRVPAEEIIHIYRKDRPGQERGVTWFAPVIVPLRELGIYEDASLKRQQIANLFAGFVTTDDPTDNVEEFEDEIPDLQPGTMYLMRPGRSVTFSNPPASDDPKFRDSGLRRIAAGLGITYEALTGNLSEVNFSSARMGAHEMGRNIDAWQYTMLIPRLCQAVFGWFLNTLELQSIDTSGVTAEWTPPARAIVDPGKEWTAFADAVRDGLMSLPEAIRAMGYDPESLVLEQSEFLKFLDAQGVVVGSDYRQSSKLAQSQQQMEQP